MLSNFCVIAIASSFLLKDLLEIGSHLYINNICLKKYILASNENFQYDPYTDTGYFGKVNESDFITIQSFFNSCFPGSHPSHSGDSESAQKTKGVFYAFTTLNKGSTMYNGRIWYKFYWHGSIVMTATSHPDGDMSMYRLYANSQAFAYDVRGDGKRPITIRNINYNYETFGSSRTYPVRSDNNYSGDDPIRKRYRNPADVTYYEGDLYQLEGRLTPVVCPTNNWNHGIYGWRGDKSIISIGSKWDVITPKNIAIDHETSTFADHHSTSRSLYVYSHVLYGFFPYQNNSGSFWMGSSYAKESNFYTTPDNAWHPHATYDIPKVD